MDPIVTMIVDLLRRGKENAALNAGGPTAGASPLALPTATAPKHQGRTVDELVDRFERG